MFRIASSLATLFLAGTLQAAPILTTRDGILTGAQGVEINGALYDAQFESGTCLAIFPNCEPGHIFQFTNATDAIVASQALLDQVLLDGALALDSNPQATAGCGWLWSWCYVVTPYEVIPGIPDIGDPFTPIVGVAITYNGDPTTTGDIVGGGAYFNTDQVMELATWAVWQPSRAVAASFSTFSVPEPGTAALLVMGLLWLPFFARRQVFRVDRCSVPAKL